MASGGSKGRDTADACGWSEGLSKTTLASSDLRRLHGLTAKGHFDCEV